MPLSLSLSVSRATRLVRILATLLIGSAVARASDGCLWDAKAPAPIPRIEGPSVVVGGAVYVFGGFFNETLQVSDQVHRYDPLQDTWSARAPMPLPLTHAGFAVDGDEVWVVGGFVGDNPGPVVDQVHVFDTVADQWSSGPSLPAPRGSGGLARLGRELHYYGGVTSDKETDQGDHFVLDLDNPVAWTTGPPMPLPRNHFGYAALGGRAYAVGGQFRHEDHPEDVAFVHAYDPQTQTWSEVASLPFGRSHTEPGTFAVGGELIVVGGRANGLGIASLPDVSAYDPLTDRWRALPPMPRGLVAPVAAAYGDRLFLSSGGIGPVAPQSATFTRALSAEFGDAVRINAGGAPFLAPSDGAEWCVDLGSLGGKSYDNSALSSIAGTLDDELYLSERSGTSQDPTRFAYRLGMEDGLYRVRLHFAEIYWGAPGGGPGGAGRRVFDVRIEGDPVLTDLDILDEVGPAAALVRTFDVEVSDGALDLEFEASVDRPKVSGIEILRLAPGTLEPYCTGAPNSTGPGARIALRGNVSVADNHFELRATGATPGSAGLFLQGRVRLQAPLGAGFRCVGQPLFRLAPLAQIDAGGGAARVLDLAHPASPARRILPGSSWNFQFWYRDGQASNLSDALGVLFTP